MKQSLFHLSRAFVLCCLVIIVVALACFPRKAVPKCHDWTKLRSIREDASGQIIIDAPLIPCPSSNWVKGREVPLSEFLRGSK